MIELVIFFAILAVLAVFFVLQRMDLEDSFADQERKTAINAMYYSLTEVYYKEHKYYPAQIEEGMLSGIDQDLLFDPWGIMVGESDSDYRYEGLDCTGDGRCKDFRLSSAMDKEDTYVLSSLEE